MSSGVLLFAHNNREIDYGKIALANAMLVKKNLDVPVSIVTDDGTIDWLRKTHEPEKVFDKVIQIQRQNIENHKPYSDTRHTKKTLGFYNLNRVDAFELSPYNKTLILDVDYLVCNDLLKNCFTSNQPLMINRESRDLLSDRHIRAFDRVEEFGIDFYWATVFYFEKNKETKLFFDIVNEVKQRYHYFQNLYAFSSHTYRNDFAFSIAVHMFNGYIRDNWISKLPLPFLQHTLDVDDFYDYPEHNKMKFLLEKVRQPGNFIPATTRNTNVHVMNKYALSRQADKIIEVTNG